MEISAGAYVVVGDVHGRVDKLQAVVRNYGDSVDGYILTGDTIDGPDTRATLDFAINQMGALCVASNHVEYAIGAMTHPDEEMRRLLATSIWPCVHDRVVSSYGIYPNVATPGSALLLRNRMEEMGHLDYLTQAPGYIEADNFVVLHADVTAQPWEQQKSELNSYIKTRMWNYEQSQMPYQLGGGVRGIVAENLVRSGLQKTLVSGHFHRHTRELGVRTLSQGKHLLLATCLDDDFVVTYESWNHSMRVQDVC